MFVRDTDNKKTRRNGDHDNAARDGSKSTAEFHHQREKQDRRSKNRSGIRKRVNRVFESLNHNGALMPPSLRMRQK